MPEGKDLLEESMSKRKGMHKMPDGSMMKDSEMPDDGTIEIDRTSLPDAVEGEEMTFTVIMADDDKVTLSLVSDLGSTDNKDEKKY